MPLNTPDNVDEVIDRSINDVFLALQQFGAKPSLKNSWLNALIVAYANRVFDFYFALDQAALEALPDTAIDNLPRWGAIYKIQPTPGAQATGRVVATGVVGSGVLPESIMNIGDGTEYQTLLASGAVLVTTKSLAVASLSHDGATTATCTTDDPHELSDNVLVTITGAVETDYNVTSSAIKVISATVFEFEVVATPSTPATGTPLVSADTAVLDVISEDFSTAANTDGLAAMTFESPAVGVDEVLGVIFSGMTGGLDIETTEEYRTRVLERIQNPVAHFNVADIVSKAKTISGVTRVFVLEITPSVGQVTVYFMRDNDDTGAIPSGAEIATVKTALDEIRPANTDEQDLIVLAPTAVPTDFSFASVVPNSSSLKNAIVDSLTAFFKEGTSVGVNVTSDAYRSVIFNTVDTTNGDTVEMFSLTVPIGDIPISTGEIATLGNVSF